MFLIKHLSLFHRKSFYLWGNRSSERGTVVPMSTLVAGPGPALETANPQHSGPCTPISRNIFTQAAPTWFIPDEFWPFTSLLESCPLSWSSSSHLSGVIPSFRSRSCHCPSWREPQAMRECGLTTPSPSGVCLSLRYESLTLFPSANPFRSSANSTFSM